MIIHFNGSINKACLVISMVESATTSDFSHFPCTTWWISERYIRLIISAHEVIKKIHGTAEILDMFVTPSLDNLVNEWSKWNKEGYPC